MNYKQSEQQFTMSQIKYHKGKLWVSITWLKQYYARPDIQGARNNWECQGQYYSYRSILDSLNGAKHKEKLEQLPTFEQLRDSIDIKPRQKTKIANNNAEKLTAWHKAILNRIYVNSMPIYNPTHIHRIYQGIVNKTLCQFLDAEKIKEHNSIYIAIQDIINSETGEVIIAKNEKVYPPLSLRTVERYLNTKEVQALYDGKRYGANHAYTSYTPTISPRYKHSIWLMDGYTNNFYINNEYRTTVTYVILDAADYEILGIATGFIENDELQRKAWRMAIEKTGRVPLEVEADGKNIVEYINGGGFSIRLSKRRNKQGSRIEQWFATVQQNYFRKLAGYRGDNILAKRKGARQNTDINPLNPAQYPTISAEHIHGYWQKLAAEVFTAKAEAISGTPVMAENIAYLFGKRAQATIARGFLAVFGELYEVPAEVHLMPKMPNDWRVECATLDEDTCHIYNNGLYLATLKRTERVQRSRIERAELENDAFGHHEKRKKALENTFEAVAESRLTVIPDEAQAALDAMQSPEYWLKELEIQLTEKIFGEKTLSEGRDMFDPDENFKIETIKIA